MRLNPRTRIHANVSNVFGTKPTRLPEPLVGPAATYAYAENGPVTSDGGSYSLGLEYTW
ncbi:hypothetical protein H1235_14290 [Pseudoxanthomonas sp. NC8]|nr:hypothetical protein H1235_14290 [Pseudoxanthomonas sp. NC8]